MEIRDNVFIVTGGASGLGEGSARMLAAAGGKVVIADLNLAAASCDRLIVLDAGRVVADAISWWQRSHLSLARFTWGPWGK